jgi:hypothetical protein
MMILLAHYPLWLAVPRALGLGALFAGLGLGVWLNRRTRILERHAWVLLVLMIVMLLIVIAGVLVYRGGLAGPTQN